MANKSIIDAIAIAAYAADQEQIRLLQVKREGSPAILEYDPTTSWDSANYELHEEYRNFACRALNAILDVFEIYPRENTGVYREDMR